ncbi:hypothetical protein EF910_31985 [Streptomyces sp. WAC07149]|uniref:hypothetical protein n=1 Tax=Streptomyces sp. WAC07149 TaxID=2487425 RepID=UPI000F768804|nr:hypothetical protein [Streptomyces sp. WAC07149]RST00358.1 hypothetical protein EF910_31985 [Streptomyces sp. WAC07149]
MMLIAGSGEGKGISSLILPFRPHFRSLPGISPLRALPAASINVMLKIADALKTWTPPRQAYDEFSYPYRYAWQFMGDHRYRIVPEDIVHRVRAQERDKPTSKGERRKKEPPADAMGRFMLREWLKETGEDEFEVHRMLAEAYLAEHRIEAPEERHEVKPPDFSVFGV